MGQIRCVEDLEGESSFSWWRYNHNLPCTWSMIQVDREVWEILAMLGLPTDLYVYLWVYAEDGDFVEIWGGDSPNYDAFVERLYWKGKVVADA